MCVACIVLSCCARPKDANLTAFANATSTLATAAKNASSLDVQIDAKLRAAAAARNYAAGSPLKFDPKGGTFITGKSDADWKAVTAFLDAVNGYATALSQANDAKLVGGVTGGITSLGTALANANAASALANPNNQQRINLISGAVADLVGVVGNGYAAIEIRAAMNEAQPILQAARGPLKDSLKIVFADATSKLEDYKQALRCRLSIAGARPGTQASCPPGKDIHVADAAPPTSLEKYDAYLAAWQDYLAIQASVQALGNLPAAVDAMIAAHEKLKDDPDNSAALAGFLQAVGDIAAKEGQFEALNG